MAEQRFTSKAILPEPTLRRLPWYLAYVRLLNGRHIEFVSSTQIAKEINVDSAQIAKDLSFLNIKGKTRIGYEVKILVKELSDFLGFKHRHTAVMIGVGSLGAALIQDTGLAQYGMSIVAGFDVNPDIIDTTIGEIPVYDMADLAKHQKHLNAAIAILAVPIENAQEAADSIIKSGIKAIWNFTPTRIKAPSSIVIQNTSIYAHLAVMYNRLEVNRELKK